jgi:hypothetical protein
MYLDMSLKQYYFLKKRGFKLPELKELDYETTWNLIGDLKAEEEILQQIDDKIGELDQSFPNAY